MSSLHIKVEVSLMDMNMDRLTMHIEVSEALYVEPWTSIPGGNRKNETIEITRLNWTFKSCK